MGLQVAEMSEFTGKAETLIETEYLGNDADLVDTIGEAYFDVPNNNWMYRPFSEGEDKSPFFKVLGEDLECANDGGWLNGTYLGKKAINKEGKASWDEGEDAWIYKPKGDKRQFVIPEDDFLIIRDADVF